MGSQSNVHQQWNNLLYRENPWYNLTLSQVGKQLGKLEKPLGSMNLDELLKNVWTCEETESKLEIENNNSSATASANALQRQASMSLAGALSGMTVDQVWNEIQQGQKKRCGEVMKIEERETPLSEMTLEDFLVQAGLFVESSLDSSMEFNHVDPVRPHIFSKGIGLSPSPSIGTLVDMKSDRKRDNPDVIEKSIERRLKRKIKNRESAARSRARKQAYHDELVGKVSLLEEENIKLKKEKEFEKNLTNESAETIYQLRRTSSMSF
ncbi:hypothetical protein ACFE04_012763 [Oxalis oulophora]